MPSDYAAKARRLLIDRDEPAVWEAAADSVDEAVDTAQVFATLAVAEAIDRLTAAVCSLVDGTAYPDG